MKKSGGMLDHNRPNNSTVMAAVEAHYLEKKLAKFGSDKKVKKPSNIVTDPYFGKGVEYARLRRLSKAVLLQYEARTVKVFYQFNKDGSLSVHGYLLKLGMIKRAGIGKATITERGRSCLAWLRSKDKK